MNPNSHMDQMRELMSKEKHVIAAALIGAKTAMSLCERIMARDPGMRMSIENPVRFIRACGYIDIRSIMLGHLQHAYTVVTNGMTEEHLVKVVKDMYGSALPLLLAIKLDHPKQWDKAVIYLLSIEQENKEYLESRISSMSKR